MRTEVAQAIEELRRQFPAAEVTLTEDGSGGVYVTVSPVVIGPRFNPSETWMGAHISAQYPYADIYPVFMGSEVVNADGRAFSAPITMGTFDGKPAWQISRRNNAIAVCPQTAVAKFLKIVSFLETLT